MTVALDTMTIIWGLQSPGAKQGNPRQTNLREMQYRAAVLLETLTSNNEKILIPCVAVAELLFGVAQEDHATFIETIQKKFFCPPFDIRAATFTAILNIKQKGLIKPERVDRIGVRSDMMIIATARAAGARTFYSNDKSCRALAQKIGLQAEDLPKAHQDMFRDRELRQQFGLNLEGD